MRGTVLNYDPRKGEGLISGDDGTRYVFKGTDFKSDFNLLLDGTSVDFEAQAEQASSIFVLPPEHQQSGVDLGFNEIGGKSKLAAGLLAFFLGGFGIHKFYLGYTGAGIIMLLVTVFGVILLGIPSIIIGVIAFIEAIIYLTKTDQDFYLTYVKNRRPWF